MNPILRVWLADKRLSNQAKLVLVELWSYASLTAPSGVEVWPSTARIANALGTVDRVVRRSIDELREVGAIEDGEGSRCTRRLLAPGEKRTPESGKRTGESGGPVSPADLSVRNADRGVREADSGVRRTGESGGPMSPHEADRGVRPCGPMSPPMRTGESAEQLRTTKNNQGNNQRADARAPVRPDLEPPRVPADPDAEQHPWRELLAEIRMLTPPGVDPIAVGRTPPPGLLDRLAEHGLRGVADRCEAFAELCRQRPEEARWWARGMFDDKRWEAIGRRLHEARTGSGAKPWAPSSSFETESNPILAEPVIDLEAKRAEEERFAELAAALRRPTQHDDQEDMWNT